MRKAKSTRSTFQHQAGEDDREFRDWINSISVTKEELAALTDMPDYSVQEVKEYLRESKQTNYSKVNVAATLRTFQSRFVRGWAEVARAFAAAGIADYQARKSRSR